MSIDRRQHFRFSSERVAFLSIASEAFPVRLRDIAEGGICLQLGFEMKAGDVAMVELAPGRLDKQDPLQLQARVIWCTRMGEAFQIGARFEAVGPLEAQRLAILLDDLAGDTPRAERPPLTRMVPEHEPTSPDSESDDDDSP